jgi:hypothetical protein
LKKAITKKRAGEVAQGVDPPSTIKKKKKKKNLYLKT